MAKIQQRKKDKDKGSLDNDIIALLCIISPFIRNLLLFRNNLLLIKQGVILHILEGIKETQVEVLRKQTSLPHGLLKAFPMILRSLLLLQKQLLFKLQADLPLLGHLQLGLHQLGL